MSFDIVIPTAGRPSLRRLLEALAAGTGPAPERVLVVDDRRCTGSPLPLPSPAAIETVHGAGRGPAAARNLGWRAATGDWVVFLDDDVVPSPEWRAALARDLAGAPADVAGVQGRVVVVLPAWRRPTDWERNVAGLADARWATADMAYRRRALQAVGGFDERFPRAYREDADLALRLLDGGLGLQRGSRRVDHPIGPAGPAVSLRRQAGNADDVLMRAVHGSGWRARAQAPRGRLRRHLAITAAGIAAVGAPRAEVRKAGAALWAAGTTELAVARIAPGPRTPREVTSMLFTSMLMPPVAAAHWARGQLRRAAPGDGDGTPRPDPTALPPLAVLLDRDGTLVHDVPYNHDPSLVTPLPGVREGLERLRVAGVKLAVVSNQSGVGRGWMSESQLAAVNARVTALLGPLGPWLTCPHLPESGCGCRKPAPGMLLAAARSLGVAPWRCAMIGDVGADVQAAQRAGMRAVLVPTARTLAHEIAAAPEVVGSFGEAVSRMIDQSVNHDGEWRASVHSAAEVVVA